MIENADSSSVMQMEWHHRIGLLLLIGCLFINVVVVLWTVNVYFLDRACLYHAAFPRKDRVPNTRDYHHGLLPFMGPSI